MIGRLFLIVGMLCLYLGAAKGEERLEVFPQIGHSQGVLALAFTPDGRILASGAGDDTVKLWEVSSRREIRTIGPGLPVVSMAFSPDGRVLALGLIDRRIKFIDAATGGELRTLTGHLGVVASVAFSPDGRILASASDDQTVKLWDVGNGNEIATLSGFSHRVFSAVFSPDGRLLAANSADRTIRLWDLTSGRELRGINGYAVGTLAFSPDGRTIAAGSSLHTIKIWDVASGREVRTLRGHGDYVALVAFSRDGRLLASSAYDKTVKIWDVGSGHEIGTLTGNLTLPFPMWASSMAFSPIEQILVLGLADGPIRLWDTTTGRELPPLGGHSVGVSSAQYSPDGRLIAYGSFDGTISIWDAAGGRRLRVLRGHAAIVNAIAFSPDSRSLVSGSADRTAKLWDVASGRELRTFSGHAEKIMSVALSPDGRILATGSGDRTVKLWDTATGNELRTLRGHSAWINSVAFSPDGRVVAASSGELGRDGVNPNNSIKLWDVASGTELRTLIGHSAWVVAVAFSPDGKLLVSASGDRTVKLWDPASGREQRTIGGFGGRVSSVAFSPDSRVLAAGVHDGTVKLFNAATAGEIRTLASHADTISSVVFTPDGQRLVTASWGSTVRVWNLASGAEMVALVAFTDGSSLAITPDGYYDASSEKAEENLNVRVGSRVFSVASYRNKFYRPDLVKLSLAGSALGNLGFAGIDSVKVAPIVELVGVPASASDQKLALNLRITDGGGGIGLVRLFVNGTAVVQDDQPHPPPAAAGGSVTRSYTVQLAGGANVVRAVAFNADDSMQSNPAVANVSLQLIPQATLHALVVGIQQFKNPNLKLGYSVADARLFADTLGKYAAPLFKGTPDIKVLTTPAETTRDGLLAALKSFQSSVGPDDLFIFYVASHGMADNGEYYLITSNVGSLSSDHLKSDAITKEELTALIANVAATKKLMVIDTCHAEALGNALQASLMTRGLDETTALKILSRAVGTTVLAASTSTQSALEGYQDHGLFTFVVADGLRGAADVDQNGFVNTLGLAHYVDRQVPELAERQFNEAQYPVIETNGQAFPLTKVK